mmetsp:Transcript_12703/g.38472  ORF Transcript_12703/g.38472 Transcript_12703/m.38472 type:complete len:588 (+) Transcript_12703:31-1794(+)
MSAGHASRRVTGDYYSDQYSSDETSRATPTEYADSGSLLILEDSEGDEPFLVDEAHKRMSIADSDGVTITADSDLPPLRERPLSVCSKVSYGFGEVGVYCATNIFLFFFNAFVLEVANLKPSLASLLLLLTQLYDAILDPVAGVVTDRVRTPWGRRRPWILFCGICMSIAYFFVWQSPSTLTSQVDKFFYYLFVIMVWHTFMSFTYVPYVALAGELTHEYDERTSLTTYRFVFGLGSGLLFTFTQGILVELFPDPNDPELVDYELGYTVAAGLFGFLFVIPFLILFFGVHDDGSHVDHLIQEKVTATQKVSVHRRVLRFFGVILGNRPFVLITLVCCFAWAGINFVQSNLVLYVKYVLLEEDNTAYVILLVQLSSTLAAPAASLLSSFVGKKVTFYVGTIPAVLVLLGAFFLGPHNIYWAYAMAVIAGIGVAVVIMIPWSMIPDVVEVDQLQTGLRREGLFVSALVFFQKTGMAVGLMVSNAVLAGVGYINPNDETTPEQEDAFQPDNVILALKILTGPVSAFLILLSYVPMAFYTLNKRKHAALRAQLEERQREQVGVLPADPLLGEDPMHSETSLLNETDPMRYN